MEQLNKTLIAVILDESGSMNIQKNDVIGGYNSFIDQQLAITTDQGRLVLIKFNSKVKVAHPATTLSEVPQLTPQNYTPSDGTALYDAVAEGVRIAEATFQKEERVLVLIITDGQENMSKKSTALEVRQLIAEKEALGNWTFAYIGENPEGWAKTMAQSVNNVCKYNLSNQSANMHTASSAVSNFRMQPMQQQQQSFFSNAYPGVPRR